MTQSDLPTIRRVLLQVIDEGDDLNEPTDNGWKFYETDGLSEEFANNQRLDFCDRVAGLLAREIGE